MKRNNIFKESEVIVLPTPYRLNLFLEEYGIRHWLSAEKYINHDNIDFVTTKNNELKNYIHDIMTILVDTILYDIDNKEFGFKALEITKEHFANITELLDMDMAVGLTCYLAYIFANYFVLHNLLNADIFIHNLNEDFIVIEVNRSLSHGINI